jgi:hypothetical protein
VIAAVIAALVLAHGSASPWKHVVVTQRSGTLAATLTYETRGRFGDQRLRRATLLIRRHGLLVLARKLDVSGYDDVSLSLRDVWGDAAPEALVNLHACGNRCSFALYVGFPGTGELLYHDFGIESAWSGQRRNGTFEFVTHDSRFFCWFTDCADSAMPVQVVAVDRLGHRFVDVSRTRTDLLLQDAQSLWRGYLEEHAHPFKTFDNSYNWYGTFVPYCADEYRLGVPAYCDRVLPTGIKRQLTAWGDRR